MNASICRFTPLYHSIAASNYEKENGFWLHDVQFPASKTSALRIHVFSLPRAMVHRLSVDLYLQTSPSINTLLLATIDLCSKSSKTKILRLVEHESVLLQK